MAQPTYPHGLRADLLSYCGIPCGEGDNAGSLDPNAAKYVMTSTGEMQRTEISQLPIVCRKSHRVNSPAKLIQEN